MFAISRKVDEQIQIGDDLFVGPTDIDEKMVRLIARGREMGGPNDGEAFTKSADLSIGGEMRLGEHVVISVVDLRGDQVRLGVQLPKNILVQRKEVADALRRERGEDERS
jgi:carbon storage regulator CsrA